MTEDQETLPCGCVISTRESTPGDRQFVIRPCSPTCKNYRYSLAETRRQGKPIIWEKS